MEEEAQGAAQDPAQDAAPEPSAEERERTEAERQEAYKEAAVEMGKAIAIGLVPFIAQAIDIYDTIESSIVLYNAKQGDAKEDAQFDFVLALIGWIPGPGDGVKKSLRLVNKDPQRFAPVLFDLLRFVLQECHIYTSPEALLKSIFDASQLKTQLEEISRGIYDSGTFESLPQAAQQAVRNSMAVALVSLPFMLQVVEKRLNKWTKKQPASSAREAPGKRSLHEQPGSKKEAGKEGTTRHASGHADEPVHGQVATQALNELTNEMVGISGEHIADYICADTFGWGKDWVGHDQGAEGHWKDGTPSQHKLGKLSKGGSPKSQHVLYKLSDGANGTGIDAVWRAEGHNGGKRYAIVEAKASRDEDAPKFLRKPNNTRKPSVKSTLGVNTITDPSELLEPLDSDESKEQAKPADKSSRKSGKSQRGVTATPTGSPAKSTPHSSQSGSKVVDVIVQMSQEWIGRNIRTSVSKRVAEEIIDQGGKVYSRHLFFSPIYHPSGSPAAHMKAKLSGLNQETHADHQAFHYGEAEVEAAVNKRKAVLRKKHGALKSLKEE